MHLKNKVDESHSKMRIYHLNFLILNVCLLIYLYVLITYWFFQFFQLFVIFAFIIVYSSILYLYCLFWIYHTFNCINCEFMKMYVFSMILILRINVTLFHLIFLNRIISNELQFLLGLFFLEKKCNFLELYRIDSGTTIRKNNNFQFVLQFFRFFSFCNSITSKKNSSSLCSNWENSSWHRECKR